MDNKSMINEVYITLQNSINNDGLWYPSISIYYSGCDKITVKLKSDMQQTLDFIGFVKCKNMTKGGFYHDYYFIL